MVKLILTLVSLSILMAWGYSRNVWESGSGSGKVVDESHLPVRGAVVLTVWRLRKFPFGNQFIFLYQESVSDANGIFKINGWGPKLTGSFLSTMDQTEPSLWVVANGFEPEVIINRGTEVPLGTRMVDATPKPKFHEVALHSIPQPISERAINNIINFSIIANVHENGAFRCPWENASQFRYILRSLKHEAGIMPDKNCE